VSRTGRQRILVVDDEQDITITLYGKGSTLPRRRTAKRD
jgi:hypothetical protein